MPSFWFFFVHLFLFTVPTGDNDEAVGKVWVSRSWIVFLLLLLLGNWWLAEPFIGFFSGGSRWPQTGQTRGRRDGKVMGELRPLLILLLSYYRSHFGQPFIDRIGTVSATIASYQPCAVVIANNDYRTSQSVVVLAFWRSIIVYSIPGRENVNLSYLHFFLYFSVLIDFFFILFVIC